jgi:hypothetical protein
MFPICPWCAGFTNTVKRLCAVRLANEEEVLCFHSFIAPPQLFFFWTADSQPGQPPRIFQLRPAMTARNAVVNFTLSCCCSHISFPRQESSSEPCLLNTSRSRGSGTLPTRRRFKRSAPGPHRPNSVSLATFGSSSQGPSPSPVGSRRHPHANRRATGSPRQPAPTRSRPSSHPTGPTDGKRGRRGDGPRGRGEMSGSSDIPVPASDAALVGSDSADGLIYSLCSERVAGAGRHHELLDKEPMAFED